MTTSDQNQSQTEGGEQAAGTGTASAPRTEAGGGEHGARHGRRRRGGRPTNEQQRQPQSQQPTRRTESGLNMDELRELTELFTTHGLTDFEFENADIRIRLSRNPAPTTAATLPVVGSHAAHNSMSAMNASANAAQAATAAAAESAQQQASIAEPPEEEMHVITSPIVGTFYRAASPTADSFVKVGSHVEPDMVVCIIEAMKLMNEIPAETTGTIAKIYVENGQPVEYGQPLFGVKK
jgi:acetyl-CoA carboxylase biotin carboxyl carrier protein